MSRDGFSRTDERSPGCDDVRVAAGLGVARSLAGCLIDLREAADRLGTRLGVDAGNWSLADFGAILTYLACENASDPRAPVPEALRQGWSGPGTTIVLDTQTPANAALAKASTAALEYSRNALATLQAPWLSYCQLTLNDLLAALDAATAPTTTPTVEHTDDADEAEGAAQCPLWTTPYRRADLAMLPATLADAVRFIVAVEQPVHRDRLVVLLSAAQRSESPTEILVAINTLSADDLESDRAGFVQQQDQPQQTSVRVPTVDPLTHRPLAHIPVGELGRAVHALARTLGPQRDELPDGVAAVFGIEEPEEASRRRIVGVVEFLLTQGVLNEVGGSIRASRAAAAATNGLVSGVPKDQDAV